MKFTSRRRELHAVHDHAQRGHGRQRAHAPDRSERLPARLTRPAAGRIDSAGGLRLRLARHRLGLRRQRQRAAARAEGLQGRRGRVRAPLRRRRAAEVDVGPAPLLVRAAARPERHLPADDLQGRRDRVRLRRRRRLAGLREHALPRAGAASTRTRSGRGSTTGRSRSPRTTRRPSGCSASPPTTRTIPPTTTCASTRRRSAWPRRTPRRGSACSWARRARRSRTRSSAARDRIARAACAAGAAWSAARTAPRTRSSRTTCGSRSATGVKVMPERTVIGHHAARRADGSDGYAVTIDALGRVGRRGQTARSPRAGVVVAAGALGTNRLLAACRLNGSLPHISPRLGELVRTNSEAILAVTLPARRARRDPAGGDHRLDLPRPRHPHRDRRLRRRGRRRLGAVHAADRGRHADHAAAEARRRGGAPPAHCWPRR